LASASEALSRVRSLQPKTENIKKLDEAKKSDVETHKRFENFLKILMKNNHSENSMMTI